MLRGCLSSLSLFISSQKSSAECNFKFHSGTSDTFLKLAVIVLLKNCCSIDLALELDAHSHEIDRSSSLTVRKRVKFHLLLIAWLRSTGSS